MKRLAPSLLSADFSRLEESIHTVEAAGAHLIHVDVMDGHFVPNISFGPVVMKSLLGKTKMPFDVHLMIESPDLYIKDFVTDNTEFITVHAETCSHLDRTIQMIRSFGIKTGVALNPATPLGVLECVFEDLDQVLLMSVNPGFGGQKFIPSVMKKLEMLRAMRDSRNPDLTIGMDGGITTKNVKELIDGGVDLAVAGSAVFGAKDPAAAVKEFLKLMV